MKVETLIACSLVGSLPLLAFGCGSDPGPGIVINGGPAGGSATSPGTGGNVPGTGGASGTPATTILFDFATTTLGLAAGTSTPPADDITASATATWDATAGSPAPGSVKIVAPFTAYNQKVDYQIVLSSPQDLSGKTLVMSVRLDSGFSPSNTACGGGTIYAKSGSNWDYASGIWTNLCPSDLGSWKTFTFTLSDPASGSSAAFTPRQVVSIGFQLNTGGGVGATQLPTQATFHIDSIGYY